MKLFGTIVLLFLANSLFANKIDSLKSDEEIVKFISKLALKDYNPSIYNISLKRTSSPDETHCQSLFFKCDTKSWRKIDFNLDNLTDLFAIVSLKYKKDKTSFDIFIAIIDDGKGAFIVHQIDDDFLTLCHVAKVVSDDYQPTIIFGHYKKVYTMDSLFNSDVPFANNPKFNYVRANDTLIYKYESFIELNKSSSHKKVKSIYFETGFCFGECPVFNMTIYEDGSAKYIAKQYNSKSGDFKTIISKDKMNVMLGLINYLNITKLGNVYSVDATDNPTCKLKIFFTDGTSKQIYDYGEKGTFGLKRLYRLIFELRDNQKWE